VRCIHADSERHSKNTEITMKRTFLIGVAAGALLAGANVASAQSMNERQQPGASEQRSGGSMERGGAMEQRSGQQRDRATSGQGAQRQEDSSKGAAGAAQQQDQQQQRSQQRQGAQEQQKSGSQQTTGQAGAGASKTLNAEQKTRIRQTVIQSGSAPRLSNVNFSLSVGTVIPRSVRLARLPPVLVEIYPQWRDYEFVVVEERIIIVEPKTLRIVAIIDV
jgi:hypothetical protein